MTRLALIVALTATISASVSTTVVLLAQPANVDAANAARVTQVRDKAVLNELRNLKVYVRSINDRVLDLRSDTSDISRSLGDTFAPSSLSVLGRLAKIEQHTRNTCRQLTQYPASNCPP